MQRILNAMRGAIVDFRDGLGYRDERAIDDLSAALDEVLFEMLADGEIRRNYGCMYPESDAHTGILPKKSLS